jgi:hypothetical protein
MYVMDKLSRFQGICRAIKRRLKNQTRRETKFHKVMAAPTFLLVFGKMGEKRDLARIQATQLNFLRCVQGCTKLDRIKMRI